jgi:deoxyribodipyrimidine photo-lyase
LPPVPGHKDSQSAAGFGSYLNGMTTSIVWFRLDLRLADNPALDAAVQRGGPVVPVFIWAPDEEGDWPPGAASRWWLHQSLEKFDAALRERGSRLIIRRGPSLAALRTLIKETGAETVFWNRRYEPALIERDKAVKAAVPAESFNSALLYEPWELKPYKVFTPFWRACGTLAEPPEPRPAPRALPAPAKWPASLKLDELKLLPKINWADGFREVWQPGEDGARAQLKRFAAGPVARYASDRDRPDLVGTSRLSPHLHFGEVSPRQVWHAATRAEYRRQLGWREFAHHLLFHFPQTPTVPLRPDFEKFPWSKDGAGLEEWKRGRTGFPLVDAGMRELWTTGWMHNRVRMVTASFLVKDLLIPWQEGARWFWDTLVDADLANNTLGWQWVAGCGADAAPFFRIFNPAMQAEKFDPQGAYVRRWVPAPVAPIVDHGAARERALEALAKISRRF